MADRIYAKGLWVDKFKFDNGGEIVKLSIKVEDFCNFIEEHMNEKGYVNIDIKEKKEQKEDDKNKFYGELNTYKKEKSSLDDISEEDIPF